MCTSGSDETAGTTSDRLYGWVARRIGVGAISRRDDVGEGAAVLALFGRFVDELASGLPLVLMPTLQRRLGLSVAQVGWCLQALSGAAAVVEPVSAVAIDVVRRRPLLVWGALGWAVSLLLVAGVPSYGWLLAAFAVAGIGSGPLAQTTDVLLVEMYPGAEERIGARQTLLDTTGALLAPAAVAAVGWAGGDLRLPLVVSGLAILGYAALLAVTPMPDPPAQHGRRDHPLRDTRAGLADVLADREARIWLVALLCETLVEIPAVFEPVWLGRDVGAPQSLVAVHAAVELSAALGGLMLLDRWLQRHDARTILTVASVANLVLYPVWLLVPGVWAKIVLSVPLALAIAPVWPLVRARALAAVPGRGGMVMAIMSLYGVLPLTALFGWVSGRVGLTPSMFAVHMTATLAMLITVRRRVGEASD